MPRFLRLQEGWLTVGLLALLLFSVTLSVQQAQWSDGLSILTPITIIGLATGILLAKIHSVPRFLLDLVGLMMGVVVVLVSVAGVMQDPRLVTVQDRVKDLVARTATWVDVAVRRDMSDDIVVFILSLAVVCWVLAYSSAYFVFKSRQLWWALVPNGVALLINLSYSYVDVRAYIVVFMFSALLLMIRFNLLMKEERWQRERVNYSPGLTWAFLWAGSAVSIVLAVTMWYVPTTSVNTTLNGMWEKVNQPWVEFQGNMSKLWTGVNGNQMIGGYSSFNKSFTMGGALNLSDSVALIVKSKDRHYWRATTYDEYTGIGWANTSADTFHIQGLSPRLALDANQQLVSGDAAREEITYTVQLVNPKGDTLFASLRPVRLNTASRLEMSWRPLDEVFSIDRIYDQLDGDLSSMPLELRSLAGRLREAQRELRDNANLHDDADPSTLLDATSKGQQIQQEIQEKRSRGIEAVIDVGTGPDFPIDLRATGEVPVYDDISSIHSVEPLARNAEYTVASLISNADEVALRAASSDYGQEKWLMRYLALPATVPLSVGALANQIIMDANAANPYDYARAIESYLRKNYTYSTDIQSPPPGVDRAAWFLFQEKQGYCEYYATSMVVMLRSLGVPARMATGYAPGAFDTDLQAYVVKESAAHAWPEVYFPGYGWIEFEPTPSQAVITRQIDNSVVEEPTVESAPLGTPSSVPLSDRGLDDQQTQQNTGGGLGNLGLPFGAAGGGALLLSLVAVAALVAWLPIMPWRRKQPPASPTVYYGKMLKWSRFLRVAPAAHQTPYEFSESLAREIPGTSLFARMIARAYVRERYSREPLPSAERASVLRAWDSLRARMWRRMPGRQLMSLFRRKRK
jgi:transglutaminase-like putative cysteine protease